MKGKISNPDQFLSTLSPKPSAFCLWKWIFYLKTPPYQKSKHIHSAGKTCQICFKLPTPVRQGSNSLPPRHGWQTKKLWVALKGGCWSFKLIGTLLGIKLLFTSGGIFVIFYTILHRSFIICNFSKCGGGGWGWRWGQGMVQNWTSPASLITSCFSAKNEALHAFSIQEVTSLADSYDSPLICADMEVSIKKEFLITQHTEMQTDETYLYMLYVKQYLLNHIKWLIESELKIIHLPKPSSMGSSTSE